MVRHITFSKRLAIALIFLLHMTIHNTGGEMMLTPMDMLSTMTTRTDSGTGVRQRSDSSSNFSGSGFGMIFENEMQKNELRKQYNTSTQPTDKSPDPVTVYEDDDTDERAGEEFAAGVMGSREQNVFFILEGDSETVDIIKIHAENNAEPPSVVPEEPEVVITEPENKQFELNPEAETAKSNVTLTGAEVVKAAEHVKETESATANLAELNRIPNAGEAEARKPDIKVRDSQDNSNQENQKSTTGNLSPLENENDTSQVEGQSQFTESAVAAINSADAERDPAENTTDTQQPITGEIAPPVSNGIKAEQFTASQQIKSEAMYAPVKQENLFEEMISRVETMKSDQITSMKIQLNPEWLGNVALEVGLDAQGLHVRINAEDSGIRGMLNGQLTALIESLEEKGIEIANFEVLNTSIGYDTTKDPHESNGNRNQSRNRQRFAGEVDSKDGVAIYSTMSEVQENYLDTGVSSVEYSA